MDKVRNLQYLIIGNGIAGLSAAKEIRKWDRFGKIIIISSENYLTYYRVKLSHYISKDFDDRDIIIHDKNWYKENDIEVILDKKVTKISPHENTVTLDDGDYILFDKLLISTGSTPLIPPIFGMNKEGVFTLRTLKDLRHIQDYFKLCKHISIIGGGLLGIEAAWSIKEMGKKVTIFERCPYLLSKQLDEELSEKFSPELQNLGIELSLGFEVDEILGEDKVKALKLKNNTIFETDAILFSIGIKPNTDITEGTDIVVNRGIKVDKYMKTNIDNIYAAGDVVECDGRVLGLWSIATEQGKVAGANMAGQNIQYTIPKPSTLLTIDNIKVYSTGDIKNFDYTLKYSDDEKNVHYKLYITDEKITGGVLIGDVSKMIKVKKAVNSNLEITPFLSQKNNCKEIIEKL